MGLAKHFYTTRIHGGRVPKYVYDFFQETPPGESPKKKKTAKKPKTNEQFVDEMLKDFFK